MKNGHGVEQQPRFFPGAKKEGVLWTLEFLTSPTDNWTDPEHDGEPLSRPSSCTDQSELEHSSLQQPHLRLAVGIAGCHRDAHSNSLNLNTVFIHAIYGSLDLTVDLLRTNNLFAKAVLVCKNEVKRQRNRRDKVWCLMVPIREKVISRESTSKPGMTKCIKAFQVICQILVSGQTEVIPSPLEKKSSCPESLWRDTSCIQIHRTGPSSGSHTAGKDKKRKLLQIT